MQDEHHEPDTIRDTVPIRPLRPWASRVFVTVALLAALALAFLAVRLMRSIASDPNVRERFEAVERMRVSGSSSEKRPEAAQRASTALPTDSARADSASTDSSGVD